MHTSAGSQRQYIRNGLMVVSLLISKHSNQYIEQHKRLETSSAHYVVQ